MMALDWTIKFAHQEGGGDILFLAVVFFLFLHFPSEGFSFLGEEGRQSLVPHRRRHSKLFFFEKGKPPPPSPDLFIARWFLASPNGPLSCDPPPLNCPLPGTFLLRLSRKMFIFHSPRSLLRSCRQHKKCPQLNAAAHQYTCLCTKTQNRSNKPYTVRTSQETNLKSLAPSNLELVHPVSLAVPGAKECFNLSLIFSSLLQL